MLFGWLGLASAWAADTIHLPPGQDPLVWREALSLTDLTAAADQARASISVQVIDGVWWLVIGDADGTPRRASIPVPVDAASRERIARQARSMLSARDPLEATWTLEEPPPAAPWVSPPRFPATPPPAVDVVHPPSSLASLAPVQVTSHPQALHSAPAPVASNRNRSRNNATPGRRRWWRWGRK
ncbi:MAG: hypothetical protein AAFV53_11140 [Myxococcota bacterium]